MSWVGYTNGATSSDLPCTFVLKLPLLPWLREVVQRTPRHRRSVHYDCYIASAITIMPEGERVEASARRVGSNGEGGSSSSNGDGLSGGVVHVDIRQQQQEGAFLP